jgi:type IV pilus assembly protein PilE
MQMKRDAVLWRMGCGVTLIETMAVVAILAMFAVPAYRSHVSRAHRIDAAPALYRAAQFVEAGAPGDASPLPAGLDEAPPSGTGVCRLRVLPADDTNGGYAVEARPIESGPMRDDACGTFALDATGLRTDRAASGAADGAVAADPDMCWNAR